MNSVSRASAGALAALARERCQRIGSVDHQGRRSPGDVYNRRAIMLVNLRALLVRLIDIVLLRGGPEQLPASAGLLAVVVAVNRRRVDAGRIALIPNAPDMTGR